MSHTVYTSFWPDRPLVVDDAELLDLTRQGLVVDAPAPVLVPVAKDTPAAPAAPQPAATDAAVPSAPVGK